MYCAIRLGNKVTVRYYVAADGNCKNLRDTESKDSIAGIAAHFNSKRWVVHGMCVARNYLNFIR